MKRMGGEDTLDGSLWTTEHITASANVTSECKMSPLPKKQKKKKRKIAVLPVKAVLVAKKNLLPYLYCVTLRRGSCLELQCKM